MRAVSDAFLGALRGSHEVSARARLIADYQDGVNPDGEEIPIIDGAVDLDGDADVRSTLDLTTDGTDLWPSRMSTALAPYGDEVYVERGVAVAGGSTEWVGLGYFRIDSDHQQTAPNGPIRLECTDRMSGLIDGRLLAPVQYGATTTYGSIVEHLVLEVYPDAQIEWDDATDLDTLGRSVIAEEDRFGFLNSLIEAAGKIWYWDHRGILVIRSLPDEATPVWSVDAGPYGVLVEASRNLTRSCVYNIVIALGEGSDDTPPVRGIARDGDPASPTYWRGRFGPVPLFYASPLLKTVAQCRSAAATRLRKRGLGLPYQVDFQAVPNPALEPWDPVEVRFAHGGGTETHVLGTVTIPLTPEQPMSATCREKTIVIISDEGEAQDTPDEEGS